MSQPQGALSFNPEIQVNAFPNVAPIFIGAHRTIGLKIMQDAIGIFRIQMVIDTRCGNGFQAVFDIYTCSNDLYVDCMSYGSAQAWLAFIVGRVNSAGAILPSPSSVCVAINTTGLENIPWPQPTQRQALPTDYQTAWDWLVGEIGSMHWTLDPGYLALAS